MPQVDDQEDGDADVRGEEARRGEAAGEEDVEAVEQAEQAEGDKGHVRAVWLQDAHVGQVGAREALGGAGGAEAEEDDAAQHPADEARGVEQADEPVEDDGAAAGADAQVGEGREARRRQHGEVRHAARAAAPKQRRRAARHRHRVQRAAGHVQHRVAAGPGRGDDDGVDDAVEAADPRVADGHDPGARGGAGAALGEPRVVRGADDADGEGAERVEDEQAPDEARRGAGQVAARGLHLARREHHELGPEVEGEGRVDHAVEQGAEAAAGAAHEELVGRARVGPELEVERLVVRPAAEEEHDGEDQQPDDGEDLDRGEPELALGVGPDGHEVEGHDHDQHDSARFSSASVAR